MKFYEAVTMPDWAPQLWESHAKAQRNNPLAFGRARLGGLDFFGPSITLLS
jgi:hypothetical protein